MSSNDEQGFSPSGSPSDPLLERKVKRFTDEFGRILHASEARITAAFSHYTELNTLALKQPYAYRDMESRLESLEARMSQVEKRLDIPPGA